MFAPSCSFVVVIPTYFGRCDENKTVVTAVVEAMTIEVRVMTKVTVTVVAILVITTVVIVMTVMFVIVSLFVVVTHIC